MDTVNGVNASIDCNAENIEVTPTMPMIFSDFDANDPTTSESNSEMVKMDQFGEFSLQLNRFQFRPILDNNLLFIQSSWKIFS